MNNLNKPLLPTLQVLIDKLKPSKDIDIENIVFVCVQHLLFTTIDLIKSLIILGAQPSNIHIMGKVYSTCPKVVDQLIEMGVIYYPSSCPQKWGYFQDYFNNDIIDMWNKVSSMLPIDKSSNIIVLDDGGQSIANVPKLLADNHSIFAIEQTSSGFYDMKDTMFPIINVAFSAAKQLLESSMIARAIVKKFDKFLPLSDTPLIFGVAGLGVIGRAIVDKLLSLNYKVIVYDQFEGKYDFVDNVEIVNDITSLFQKADYIFGCTGKNITESIDINIIKGVKNLISCSSKDIEFQSLLRIIQSSYNKNVINILDNIEFPIEDGVIKIFRGGFPINLDNSGESVPAKDIQLTRGLLLGGMIQAMLQLPKKLEQNSTQYMLCPKIQKLVVKKFIDDQPNLTFDDHLIENFEDEEWIKNNSASTYIRNDYIVI
jgi:S-adenosylhomocysteine hydrolase